MQKLKSLIEDRQRLVTKKTSELKEVELELKVNQNEIDKSIELRDSAIDEILAHFEKVTGSEFMHVINTNTKFSDREKHLLNCFVALIEKTEVTEGYDLEKHGSYFHDREELIRLLDERRGISYDDACFNEFKELTL